MSDAGGGGKPLANIPGYELERELGRGGFAVVYRANQPKLRRTVALKVLTNVDPTDDDAKRRFESECQAIGSLSWHPHVVTVYDAGATEEGLPFLAMENLPSGSLQAKLADHGPAPWEEILRVTVQMCDALGAAHQAGILHRDIKPANVLTSRIGDYKLADFGIARFGDSQRTATGVITGTVAYTAPEVLRGSRASTASDIYALGAMLCAVATGRTPFVKDADESVVAIMYRVNTEDPPGLAEHGVPDDVALLIHTLMDKDPEKRPESALEVAQWAQHIQEGHGLTSAPLHTDPDLEPGLPEAAIAAGAASLTPSPEGSAPAPADEAPPAPSAGAAPTATPAPQSYPGTPAPVSYTPAPQPVWGGTPAPQTGYPTGAEQPSGVSYPAATGYTASTGYTTGYDAYGNATGAYAPSTGADYGYDDEGPNGARIVAIVAVVALVIVALIIAIVAIASSGGSGSSAGTTNTRTEEAAGAGADAVDDGQAIAGAPSEGETGEGFSEQARADFTEGCTTTATPEQCDCILGELEQLYTEDELRDLDSADLPPEVLTVAVTCASS